MYIVLHIKGFKGDLRFPEPLPSSHVYCLHIKGFKGNRRFPFITDTNFFPLYNYIVGKSRKKRNGGSDKQHSQEVAVNNAVIDTDEATREWLQTLSVNAIHNYTLMYDFLIQNPKLPDNILNDQIIQFNGMNDIVNGVIEFIPERERIIELQNKIQTLINQRQNKNKTGGKRKTKRRRSKIEKTNACVT